MCKIHLSSTYLFLPFPVLMCACVCLERCVCTYTGFILCARSCVTCAEVLLLRDQCQHSHFISLEEE